MDDWEIIDSGVQPAKENMRLDAEMLEKAGGFSRPVLHHYEWQKPSATYGYFADPGMLLNLDNARGLGLDLAKRPTGGGIIFHLWDLAFSVLAPAHCPVFSQNTLENYAFVNNAVLASVKAFLNGNPPLSLTPDDFTEWDASCSHFCMAKPTKYDVMWEGRKVAGAAQRKTRAGFLHQGTIALVMPSVEYLSSVLLPGTQVLQAMQYHTCPLLGPSATEAEMREAKAQLRALLATHLSRSSSMIKPHQ